MLHFSVTELNSSLNMLPLKLFYFLKEPVHILLFYCVYQRCAQKLEQLSSIKHTCVKCHCDACVCLSRHADKQPAKQHNTPLPTGISMVAMTTHLKACRAASLAPLDITLVLSTEKLQTSQRIASEDTVSPIQK